MAKKIERLLWKMTIGKLKKLVKEYGISAKGCKLKKEYISAIIKSGKLGSEDIERILLDWGIETPETSERELEKIGMETREMGTIGETEKPSGLDDLDIDPLIIEAKELDTSFRPAEEFLSYANIQFASGDYENAIVSMEKALESATETMTRFQTAILSHSILSSQKMIEECMKTKIRVDDAIDLLQQTKRVFKDGSYKKKKEMVDHLLKEVKGLVEARIKNTKNMFSSIQSLLDDAESIGANVETAKILIQKARYMVKEKNYSQIINYLEKAKESIKQSYEEQVEYIKERIPATKEIVMEAKNIGANVKEAEKLLDQAKIALQNKDYILCIELTKRAETKATETQRVQIQKAISLRDRQVKEISDTVLSILSLVEKIKSHGIDVSEIEDLAREARAAIKDNDYVKGTMFVKKAEKLARELESRMGEMPPKPTSGVCKECGSDNLKFFDNGWGKCLDCGARFQWFVPKMVVKKRRRWKKIKEFLSE